MAIRKVRCAHQDDVKNCPECWEEFTGEPSRKPKVDKPELEQRSPLQSTDSLVDTQQPSEVELRKAIVVTMYNAQEGKGNKTVGETADVIMQFVDQHLATEVEKVLDRLEAALDEMPYVNYKGGYQIPHEEIEAAIHQERNKLKGDV